jgi:methylated-DNA-[protein]-cysteine S-methyltransferase
MVIYTTYYNSPVGAIEISGTVEGITTVMFANAKTRPRLQLPESTNNPKCIRDCVWQLTEYFEGKRKTFLLPILMEGTAFQKSVWTELLNIPFGKTITYAQQAKAMQNEKGIRAIASANGNNEISIIVPCHRVIGSNGELTGYAGDLWVKEWLINHERKFSGQPIQGDLFE